MTAPRGARPDRAIRVVLPESAAEVIGAILMERLGPFSQEPFLAAGAGSGAAQVSLVFYPEASGLEQASVAEVRAIIPSEVPEGAGVLVEEAEVGRDWEEGWKDHFRPIVVGSVRIRPPWEPALSGESIDVVINPGMGFGTGLHPTTRGTLGLLQGGAPSVGALVDAGTGSGVLAIAAAKLGWAPILAFDNDPVALSAAAENVAENGVADTVRLLEADASSVGLDSLVGATVLANMTLDPVSQLLRRLMAAQAPKRLIVSGILAGDQERELLKLARRCGLLPGARIYEAEWVSMELLPSLGAK